MVSLSVQNVSIIRQQRTLLDQVTLSARAGESIAVIGPNGAGKSTLLKTIAGLGTPSEGSVSINGCALPNLTAIERARAIGYMPQHFAPHWDILVRDLLRIAVERVGARDAGARVEAVLASHALGDFAARWWSTLSGGERARILLAMVTAIDPPIVLADEPAASLDPLYRLDMIERIANHRRSGLCIAVMHDIDLAFRYFDRIVMMNGGRIIADGSAKDLFEAPYLEETFGVYFLRSKIENFRLTNVGRPITRGVPKKLAAVDS